MDGRALGEAVGAAILTLVAIAFTAGVFFMWALPKLWHWIKPIIHQVTA